MEERVAELERQGHDPGGRAPAPAHHLRPGDDARAGLLLGHRELLAPPRRPRGRLAAVDAARLLPARLAAGRRREPHDHPPGRGHVQERPDPQGDPGRVRLPAAVRARQPAAHLRGVRGPPRPGRLHVSARPGAYELERSKQVVEQLIRPTGIVDPTVQVQPTEGQIDDLLERIRERVVRGERVLVTTLTKRWRRTWPTTSRSSGVKVNYLHSEVDTLERVQILRDLRLGVYDVLVGINLLREGIDLPEVTLVAILDADKEGFLRSAWSLIQVSAARPATPAARSSCTPTRSPSRCGSRSTRRTAGAASRRPTTASTASSRHDHQGDPRHQRPPARGRRPPGGYCVGRGVGRPQRAVARADRPVRRPARGQHARGGPQPRVRAGGGPARPGPGDPPARPRGGRLGHRRPRRGGRRRWRPRAAAVDAAGDGARGVGTSLRRRDGRRRRGDGGGGPAQRRGACASRRRARTTARPPTGCPASATSTRTTAAGRRGGWTGRRGTATSPQRHQADGDATAPPAR